MNSPVTILMPSYCPTLEVKGYEIRCLDAVAAHTPRELYDLISIQGGDWSFPQKINAGMTGVRTEYTVVLSNDVFVGPGWLETLLSCYEDAERIADCAVLAPSDDPKEKQLFWEEHWWALTLFRTRTFRCIGGFDESLPYTYHDQDLSIRLRQSGRTILRTGSVLVEHVNMATRRHMPVDDTDEQAEMLRRYGVTEYRDYLEKIRTCV